MDKPEKQAVVIPTYVLNFDDWSEQIRAQFSGKPEFDLRIIDMENSLCHVWKTVVDIIKQSIANEDDIVIICDSHHEFTSFYSFKHLVENILAAHPYGTGMLLGGAGSLNHSVPITNKLCWLDIFTDAHFFVIYGDIYHKILAESLYEQADLCAIFSDITSNKMIVYPFISKPVLSNLILNGKLEDLPEPTPKVWTASKKIEKLFAMKRYYEQFDGK